MKKWLLLLTVLFLAGCSDDPETGTVPYDPAYDTTPRNLSYSNGGVVTLTHQLVMTPVYPTYSGSVITNFSISPSLPQGLSFSSLSGRIAGTPEVLILTPQVYTITGTNSQGSTSSTVSIQVLAQPPFGLVYQPADEIFFVKGVTDPVSVRPSFNKGIRGGAEITSFSISPSTLPPGLDFDAATGSISGIPSGGLFPLTIFTITGSNSGGSTTGIFAISIKTEVKGISAGGRHTCAIVDKKVKCWGDNKYGQVGNGTNTNTNSPVSVTTMPGVVEKVLTGAEFTCAGNNLGRGFCWGRNHQNQLGLGITGDKNVATDNGLGILTDISVSKSGYENALGKNHQCIRTISTGNVKCYGEFDFGNLNGDGNLVKINASTNYSGLDAYSSGGDFVCFSIAGAIKCFGNNSSGQLGDNQISGLSSQYLVPSSLVSAAVEISSGHDFACSTVDLDVKCWGKNNKGQLGKASLLDSQSATPVAVEGLDSSGLKQFLTTGYAHACVVVNGKVKCWGDNSHGQLGNGSAIGSFSRVPVQVIKDNGADLENVTSLSAGESHTCATTGSDVYCWGRGLEGQLGNLGNSNSNRATAVDASIY